MTKTRELAELFYKELKWFAGGAKPRYIRECEYVFGNMLKKGTTPEYIEQAIKDYKRKNPTKEKLWNLISVESIFVGFNPGGNLIEKDKFYFHPRLQLSPGAPTLKVTEDGELVPTEEEAFFLEVVDSFTMYDLVEYFYQKSHVKNKSFKRDSVAFEYFFKQIQVDYPFNQLDLILFTIDEAVSISHDKDKKPPTSAIKLIDYADEGYSLYMEKYNNSKIAGVDHVIPR